MNYRYLCTHHAQVYCQNLEQAQRDWESSMAMGLEAVNSRQLIKAERGFGSAYEIATIIFDRQISNNVDIDMTANTLLSAQYLATSLVQQNNAAQAKRVLKQLYDKFNVVCRNPSVDESLRETVCNHLIPYLEKLYQLVLGASVVDQPDLLGSNLRPKDRNQVSAHKPSNVSASFWHKGSTLYH